MTMEETSLRSQLPDAVLATITDFFAMPLKPDREGGQHDIRRSSLRNGEARVLAALVRYLRPENSIEVGLGTAGSCVAITAIRKYLKSPGVHIALDPFQETAAKGSGLLELQRLGLADQVQWIPQRSECYLHDKWKRDEVDLDFAFVDGGHDIGQTVTDAFYIARVLRSGGVVAFHDALLFSTATAVRYLIQERGFSPIPLIADNPLKRMGRSVQYARRLGFWYATQVIPCLCGSIVALRCRSLPKENLSRRCSGCNC